MQRSAETYKLYQRVQRDFLLVMNTGNQIPFLKYHEVYCHALHFPFSTASADDMYGLSPIL